MANDNLKNILNRQIATLQNSYYGGYGLGQQAVDSLFNAPIQPENTLRAIRYDDFPQDTLLLLTDGE